MHRLFAVLMTLSMMLALTIPVSAEEGAGSESTPTLGYADLEPGAWYCEAVDFVLTKGLMTGVGNDLFAPGDELSRSMIATILWSLAGKPAVDYAMDFADVAEGQWYTEPIRWAASEGIAAGYSNGDFGVSDTVSREQLATMLYRYEQSRGGGFTGAWMFPLRYTDAVQVSSWAYEPMCWMTMKGIIGGKGDGILDPKGAAVRAEAAQMLMRFLERQISVETLHAK